MGRFKLEIKKELLKAQAAIRSFLNPIRINALARSVGFVKRMRKISGYDVLCFLGARGHSESLSGYVSDLIDFRGYAVRKQSLDAKFKQEGVDFLKELFDESLEMLFDSSEEENCINLKDSTCFQCTSSLSNLFKGNGGGCSTAGFKVQNEYDLLRGGIQEMSLEGMAEPDSKAGVDGNKYLKKGDLSIRDLGYMTIDSIADLDKRGVFYVYRLKRCNIYTQKDDKYIKISFKDLYKKVKTGKTEDMVIYMGPQKHKTRLVASLVPEKVYEERIRKRRAESKKRGHTPDNETIFKQHFNLFITNTTISTTDIRKVYRLRWQVELAFKGWKSFEDIAVNKDVKPERVLMELYARLIWIVIKTRIENVFVNWGRENEVPISAMKTRGYLAKHSNMLWDYGEKFIELLINTWKIRIVTLTRETKKDENDEKYNWEDMLKKLKTSWITSYF